MYARSDITMLALGNSFQRLQVEDMTVHIALSLTAHASSSSRGWQPPTHSALQQVQISTLVSRTHNDASNKDTS